MPKRANGAAIPLLVGPAVEGLSLREQIYRTCLEAIVLGHLHAGARLPSARQLASDWRVSRNTIDDALARLQADGLIVRKVGAGTFVAAQLRAVPAPLLRARRPSKLGRAALADVSATGRHASQSYTPTSVPRATPFLAGLPALDAFPLLLWRRLVARRWRVGGAELLGYFPSLGHFPLRRAVARHLAATRGIACSAEQVMIVNSAMQALDLVARVLLESTDSVLIENPCLPNLRAALAMSAARVVPVKVDRHGMQVAEGLRNTPGAALICVSPSCQYPTGATLSLERRLALVEGARAIGAWIIEDDYQSEFTYEGRPVATIHSLDRGQRTLYLGSFTNSVFPALRLAYLVLPESLVPVFEAVRRQFDDHTHGPMQAVLADFIDGGHFTAHLRRMRAIYHERRDALVAACDRALPASLIVGPAAGGMNVALHLPPRLTDRVAVARAAAAGLKVLPLSRFALPPERWNGLLLGYTALPPRRIADGIVRLARALARDR